MHAKVLLFACRAIIISQFCQAAAFWNLFSWLPLYFEEVYPNSKVLNIPQN